MASDNNPIPIEEDFSRSWDGIIQALKTIFLHSGWQYKEAVFDLITLLRERGYDRQLRAGLSFGTIILSRSQEYGLRPEQPRLYIDFQQVGGMTVRYFQHPDVNIQLETERIELTPEIVELLARRLAHPID